MLHYQLVELPLPEPWDAIPVPLRERRLQFLSFIIINLFVAALVGTIIPLFLKLIKLDPALGSVNLLTMCTDSIGFAVFLGLGTLFLQYLS